MPPARPSRAVLPPIRAAASRLDDVHPSVEAYLALVQSLGTVRPWEPFWERCFRYDLQEVPGGVRARTSAAAVLEDFAYGEAHDPAALWPLLQRPALLLRAGEPILPADSTHPGAWVLAQADVPRFLATVPDAEAEEVGANHYGIVAAPRTGELVAEFLGHR